MLAPMEIGHHTARFLSSTSKSDEKSTAAIVREAIALLEQVARGNLRLVVTDRAAFDALQKKQGMS